MRRARKASTLTKTRKGKSTDAGSIPASSTKQCGLCLKPLGKVHGNKKFCSDYCRNRADRIKDYGLTPEDYRELTKTGKCFICGRKMKKMHIDHDHESGIVYGIVCAWCNERVLAHIGHGERGLQRATRLVEYLQNPPAQRIREIVVRKDFK